MRFLQRQQFWRNYRLTLSVGLRFQIPLILKSLLCETWQTHITVSLTRHPPLGFVFVIARVLFTLLQISLSIHLSPERSWPQEHLMDAPPQQLSPCTKTLLGLRLLWKRSGWRQADDSQISAFLQSWNSESMTQSRHSDKREEWGRRDTADTGLMVLGNREDTEGEGGGKLEMAPRLLS